MTVADTGAQLLLDGCNYYRQMDDLAINLCVAKTISDPGWVEFLEVSLRLAEEIGRRPKAIVAAFAGGYPDAVQRKLTYDFLARNRVPAIERLGLVSDNPLLRGAIVAFSWVVPKATVSAFGSRDIVECLRWLREVAVFDEKDVARVWDEARATLRMG